MNIAYIKNQKENLQNKNLEEYYINKYKINKSILEKANSKNIVSNYIIQSPIIIISLLNNLSKHDFHLENVLNVVYLFCITNENNIIYLLRQNILLVLLNINRD